ncbi:glycosyltransferase family protein [Steroidobacter sp.]|uniref:CgeB family protein n=1 Tax=Steroidobacter sp. TaxID=1978227 RepID=UPI001A3A94B2|nr:glycosyltransferase [Steroidobacter sp.]MBL8270565.1 glycosyltransferase [Steroidobacter sp.]
MKLAIFGLTISSSWSNGHATLWRGLGKALTELGHQFVFFEHDEPHYANSRDWPSLPPSLGDSELVLYSDWAAIETRARRELATCDTAIVSSYCFDAQAATDTILDARRPLAVYYDLDTPLTLETLRSGKQVPYIPWRGLGAFDLVLSYTGGAALEALRSDLCAHRVRALYGHVDPDVHHPVGPLPHYRADLSWLGTYSADRQVMLQELFVTPARLRPRQTFLIGGAQYPEHFPWSDNVHFAHYLPPQEHAAFFSSSRLTLNVTREPMARLGWCPSARLFEAAACGTAVLCDEWCGLDDFYTPDQQILVARSSTDTLAALDLSDQQLQAIGRTARERTLDEHTSMHRARQLIHYLEELHSPPSPRPVSAHDYDASRP